MQYGVQEKVIQLIPKVYITREAKNMLDLYIQHTNAEVSGLGSIFNFGSNLLIDEIYLFKQKVTKSTTKIDQSEIAAFMSDMFQKGFSLSSLRVWWHSHCDMGVFWSHTDETTIAGFSDGEWFVSIVSNKNQQYLCRLDQFQPLRISLTTELLIFDPPSEALIASVVKEIKEKVTMPKVLSPKNPMIIIPGNSAPKGGAKDDDDADGYYGLYPTSGYHQPSES